MASQRFPAAVIWNYWELDVDYSINFILLKEPMFYVFANSMAALPGYHDFIPPSGRMHTMAHLGHNLEQQMLNKRHSNLYPRNKDFRSLSILMTFSIVRKPSTSFGFDFFNDIFRFIFMTCLNFFHVLFDGIFH